ncbi:Eco57I restriction-modification methylase domain-containing protein [Oleidesulfovibrio alaskensis]|uniref:Eco57I restriction-modification methylase domain-containing protein n=1 Tax=Oleidesulfovibrio alaskensis TaxID=58180 RepID=UPI001A504822|nr:DNA methyltransferase [Oleidesulfovibrio alaskensis]MBL3581669.1 SAM-dependent DNA methyltransferase [Oleidesulfovibrio alaskensis]MBL3588148.1 SAM-dependent DNA methyltransferase [bacterium]
MQPLDKTLRNRLERTIKDARDIAEDAARAALEQLGVGEAAPFAHLSEQDRELRRKLRVHGRQLGDSLNGGKIQTMDRLIEEVAYEHWHRMLFARFLAENNLLMYPDPDDPVAVTLEECEDLAADEGAANGWELAARFAARMLPQIFRLDSPVFHLVLPPEYQQKLERLVADLELPVFTASDSLGWVYQFWQAKKKDEVNASEVKIGARELPAVTQLFTEPYMVSFLLDNSLGAWWAAKRLTEADLQNAKSEEELRRKAAIPGVPLDYLRFVQQEDDAGNKRWTPAAGTFDGWPEQLADLKTLDPCCGSGHFLVAAFLMLVPMRMERDGLSAREAVDAVLRENIHGLELDQRCVELAAFALALTAWKYPSAGGYRVLPELNVACSGLSISAKKEEWLALAGDNTNLRLALDELYKQFKDAPVLGSLINPEASLGKGSLFELKWEEVGPLLTKALAGEENDEKSEMGAVAKGIAKASVLLSQKYAFTMTNVPYLGKGKMNEILLKYLDKNYSSASNDLATSLIERMEELLIDHGNVAFVSSQNWMFLGSFSSFRKQQLQNMSWKLAARLGYKSFSTQMYDFPVVLGVFEKKSLRVKDKIHSVAVEEVEHLQKSKLLCCSQVSSVSQAKQLNNPQFRLTFDLDLSGGKVPVKSTEGLSTGDSAKYICCFWEIANKGLFWDYFQASPSQNMALDGLSTFIRWEKGEGELAQSKAARIQGHYAWKKQGIIVGRVGDMRSTPYLGKLFDKSAVVLTPQKETELITIYSFCTHPDFNSLVRQLDKKLGVATSVFESLPFDLDHWTKVAEEKYPNGLPKPCTDDPTQWIFHGHPCGSVVWDEEKKWTAHGPLRTDDSVLHVAVARLLGYRWPAELDTSMELADEQREWVKRCESLAGYADDDGIVCIPPVRGEASASDRLLNLLAAAYGDAWSNDTLAALLKSADHAGKTLETWLREKFFTQHCKLFQHRPFIWHIWDGLRDGFAALVNYHKLDAKLLETLIYTYLGDWISRQKQDIASHVDGAQERLAAAEALKKKLELILEGESPYDIFVRWKPLEKQPIGWDPDLNDGVRLNIRPFLSVPDVGKRGAGVLRDKPNINWNKDRGKDVESAPWYHVFDGDRINDHHLTLAEKRAAREAAE